MDARVKEFKKLAATFGAGKGRRPAPYPERCRRLAVDYADERLDHGASLLSVAQTLGVSHQSLSVWRDRYSDELRPVRVTTPPEAEPELEVEPEPEPEVPAGERTRPVLVLPSGARVEGLDVDDVITVLKAVG